MRTSLPSIIDARLPATYERAKEALAECSRIDECQDWADKAQALASYAKQAKDEQLRKLADRIQARAIRRCGELLKTYNDGVGRPRLNGVGGHPISQRQAADDSGLSKHQEKTAVRVANVPGEQFEAAVESDQPPTITTLAKSGTKSQPRPLINLNGREPREFAISTDGQAQLRQLAEFAQRVDPAAVARGAMPNEIKTIRRHVSIIDAWLDQLIVHMED